MQPSPPLPPVVRMRTLSTNCKGSKWRILTRSAQLGCASSTCTSHTERFAPAIPRIELAAAGLTRPQRAAAANIRARKQKKVQFKGDVPPVFAVCTCSVLLVSAECKVHNQISVQLQQRVAHATDLVCLKL
eukprot:20952-Heterococcus_DN1.PRE.5